MPRSLTRGKKPSAATVFDDLSDGSGSENPGPGIVTRVRVLEWPRWMTTSYLPKIVDGLRDEGLDVTTPYVLSSGGTHLRSGDWLHLHWSTEAHLHRFRWLYLARGMSFHRRMRLLKRRGVRIAWTAHNLVPHDDPHPDLGRRFRKDLLRYVDHVFIHFAGAQATLAEEFGYTGPCTVVHHPHYVDTHPAPPPRAEARAQLGLPTEGFVALSFGKIRPYKGTADIIQAFKKMARQQDRLVIAGKPEGDVADELALAADDPRIIVHAWRIPDDDLPTYFAVADAAVVAHRAFFTSGSALLALSMGCPLVGPDIYHLADMAGGLRLYPIELGIDGLAVGLIEAREKAHEVDRAAVREWATGQGTWRDATAGIARVFRGNS